MTRDVSTLLTRRSVVAGLTVTATSLALAADAETTEAQEKAVGVQRFWWAFPVYGY